MKITNAESMVLKAVTHADADCGEYVSIRAIEVALPEHGSGAITTALRDLTRKGLIRCDEHGCAAVTEGGGAFLKSV